jgi:hypothetical protein
MTKIALWAPIIGNLPQFIGVGRKEGRRGKNRGRDKKRGVPKIRDVAKKEAEQKRAWKKT